MTTLQVYKMAGTENKLLNHIKSRKLRFCGHVMRQPHDNIEGSIMSGLAEGESEGVVDGKCAGLTTFYNGLVSSASEVTTLWRYTNLFIIIIIIMP